jgi:tetratricopeptide (TPR) repeat protein
VLLAVFLLLGIVSALGQQTSVSIAAIESRIRSKDYAEAVRLTNAALHDRPDDYRVWTLQGIAFSLKGNSSGAVKAFQQALSFSPNYLPALKGEIQILYRRQDNRAIPLLRQLLKVDAHDETAHEMLAVLEGRQGKCRDAISHFLLSTGAMARHPGSLEVYGYCLQQTKQTLKAIQVFEKLAVLLPDQDYLKYDLAILLVDTEQYGEALRILEPLLTATHPDPDVLSLASQAYEASGNTPKAVATLRQAIVLNPANPNYYTAFALICLDHESYQVGIDMLNVGLQQIAGDSSLYVSRGLLYAQLAEYDKAETDFKMAERLDSGQSMSSYALDLAELEKDRPDVALAKVRAQLEVHPNSASHHFLLAKLLEKDASAGPGAARQEAIGSALAAVKLKPAFVEAHDLLASLYISSEQFGLARRQSELALKYNPIDEAAIYHLIVALRHSSSPADREQLRVLAKRLAEAQQLQRKKDVDRKRFKLVEDTTTH